MVEDSALADGRVLTWVYHLDLLLHELQAPGQPRQSNVRFLVAVQNPCIVRKRHSSDSILQRTRLEQRPVWCLEICCHNILSHVDRQVDRQVDRHAVISYYLDSNSWAYAMEVGKCSHHCAIRFDGPLDSACSCATGHEAAVE